MRTLLFVLLMSISFPAFAQSGLGFKSTTLSFGLSELEDGSQMRVANATIDVAVTNHHGFQGDIAYTGDTGTVAAHLYMEPKEGQKFGLFVALSDVDGREMLYGSVGAEGMFTIAEATTLEMRLGTGWADKNGLDYVFGSAAIARQMTPSLELELGLDVADFDEAGFSATSYDLGLTATYTRPGSPLSAYASVTSSGLSGANGAPAETRLGLGIKISLGASGGVSPHTRPFRTPDPVAPLIRRGLW